MVYTKNEILPALQESNAIEEVYSDEALRDAYNAWKYINKTGATSFTTKSILGVHKKLMENLDSEIAGKWRDDVVYIGGRCVHYIDENLLKEEMKGFIKTYRLKKELGELKEDLYNLCKQCHIAFEFLHPFFDGNGRTGRILYYYQMQRLGLPLKIIKADTKFEEYYKWFKQDVY
jgi:Fic family protein